MPSVKAKLGDDVAVRGEKFGGVAYVGARDDFFALDRPSFALVKAMGADWSAVNPAAQDAYAALARLGVVKAADPVVSTTAYSGPSFIGAFDDIPSVSEPLVVNCFATAFCPLKCVYCHADDLMYPARESETDEQIARVIETARAVPAIVAVVTGGDPLTAPGRAVRLMDGLRGHKRIVFDTSGVGDIEALLEPLARANAHVRVSLDSVNREINRRYRPTNRRMEADPDASLVGATRTIQALVAARVHVSVQTVVHGGNHTVAELRSLRDYIVALGVRNWVLHMAVPAGKGRQAARADVRRSSNRKMPTAESRIAVSRMVAETMRDAVELDIRCTDSGGTPNAVLLIDSDGNLRTEGYAHPGKTLLYRAGQGRPDLLKDLWPYIDKFGHARRYFNWNAWMQERSGGVPVSIRDAAVQLPGMAQVAEVEQAGVVEREAKYRIVDHAGLVAELRSRGWPLGEPVSERDEYFDDELRNLAELDFVVRLRVRREAHDQVQVALKGPRFFAKDGSHGRIELEFPGAGPDQVRSALLAKGLMRVWYLEKTRRMAKGPGRTVIAVDELPGERWFCEVEGAQEDMDAVVRGIAPYLGAVERRNYAEVVRDEGAGASMGGLAFGETGGVD